MTLPNVVLDPPPPRGGGLVGLTREVRGGGLRGPDGPMSPLHPPSPFAGVKSPASPSLPQRPPPPLHRQRDDNTTRSGTSLLHLVLRDRCERATIDPLTPRWPPRVALRPGERGVRRHATHAGLAATAGRRIRKPGSPRRGQRAGSDARCWRSGCAG